MPDRRPTGDDDLRLEAEGALRSWREVTPRRDVQAAHDVSVQRIELEIQNEELRNTHQALQAANRELTAAQQRYADLFKHAPVAYLTVGRDLSVNEANEAASRLLRQPLALLTRQSLAAFIAPGSREKLDRWLKDVILHRQVPGCEIQMLRGDDTEFHARVEAVSATQLGARELRIALVDISALLAAESALLAERTRLHSLLETAPAGVLAVTADGEITMANPQARRVLRLAAVPERIDPRRVRFERPLGYRMPPERFPLARALRGETVEAEEVWVRYRRTAKPFPVLLHARPVRDGEGPVREAILFIVDLTPLADAERLKSEFLAMVGHELRTPLVAIISHAGIGLHTGQGDSRPLFAVIEEQGVQLSELINSLMDLSRAEGGLFSVAPEEADLSEILREAVARATQRLRLKKAVQVDVQPGLAPVLVDRQRVGQVVLNLLVNAAKFSPPDAPVAIQVEGGDTEVVVHVVDQGRGFTAQQAPRLFQKFSPAHDPAMPGVGLGLAICKGIVEAHGGRIWAESDGNGHGATFSFSLPVYHGGGRLPS